MEFKPEFHIDMLSLSVPLVLMLKLMMFHLRNSNTPVRLVTMGKAGIACTHIFLEKRGEGIISSFSMSQFC